MQRSQTNETNLQKTNNNTSSSIFSDAILDDTDRTVSDYLNDIEHIQDQITILEDYLGAKYHDFETKDILLNTWLQNYRR